ncbi:MAG: hypothetical protein JO352_14945, partial [Chloroflexi bacterium]|nr:hypothetical protein [Chloroflexota bacterium]
MDQSRTSSWTTARFTRRRMLLIVGAATGTGLLAASTGAYAREATADSQQRLAEAVAAVAAASAAPSTAQAASPKPGLLEQATQTGFQPIDSKLTFGPPTDLASGWDGTLWSIDSAGAPHVYDRVANKWELFGSGIDAAALINGTGPAVYFRGPEVFIADGKHPNPLPIAKLWPDLPASYKLGVQGAAWCFSQLCLFRGGTFLGVAWPPSGVQVDSAPATPTASVTPGGTPGPSASPTPQSTAASTSTPSAAAQQLVFGPMMSGAATATQTPTPSKTATPAASATPTPHSGTPTATTAPTASSTASPTPTSTGTPSPTDPPTATPTPTPGPAAAPEAIPLHVLPNWPQSDVWKDGVIDSVYPLGPDTVLLVRGQEGAQLVFTKKSDSSTVGMLPAGPQPVRNLLPSLPADWQVTGFDCGFGVTSGADVGTQYFFKGPRALVIPHAAPSGKVEYIASSAQQWPSAWHPVLQHAPSGRSGGLWAATTAGGVVSHDGTRWTQQPGSATHVSAGADGTVCAVSQNSNGLHRWTGSGWQQVAQAGGNLSQVSVGDKDHVWVRDSGNTVHQLNQAQLQPVPRQPAAADIAANYDGTLWSCNASDPHAFRLNSGDNVPPQAIGAQASVHKVASTGFGAAHCLTQQGDNTQLYRYVSPYVFKSAGNYPVSGVRSTNPGANAVNPVESGLGQVYLTTERGSDFPHQDSGTFVVALDAHTGQEVSRSAPPPNNLAYTAPVYDPIHQVVIVGLTNFGAGTAPSHLVGLDARDLTKVRWTITPPNGMNVAVRPTLQDTLLCFTDNVNTIAMYDTGAAPTATPT